MNKTVKHIYISEDNISSFIEQELKGTKPYKRRKFQSDIMNLFKEDSNVKSTPTEQVFNSLNFRFSSTMFKTISRAFINLINYV